MILRMTLERPIHGWWDGGARDTFDFRIDGPPHRDARGWSIRVGAWTANYWCHVALGATAKATLGHARRHLAARAKRAGVHCRFTYLDTVPNPFERQAFGGAPVPRTDHPGA